MLHWSMYPVLYMYIWGLLQLFQTESGSFPRLWTPCRQGQEAIVTCCNAFSTKINYRLASAGMVTGGRFISAMSV